MKSSQRVGVISQFTRWARMVRWYDPGQLARTGVDVIVATMFGRYADRRMTDALRRDPERREPFDYTLDEHGKPRDVLWLDYIADLGDGWHSTYNVAYTASRPRLTVRDPSGAEHETRRGDVLVFGGDQVYPVASRSNYRDRLIRPYEGALRDSEAPHPHVYAVPGNHDWYDNLVAFGSLFCTGRWFAGWKTRQQCSYFALALPHQWWLIGTDVQLDSDIDAQQLAYFRTMAARMKPDDRIILCVAEPHWIYARTLGKYDDNCNESNLAFLEQRVFQRKISVYLAGDLHHYRRHADAAGAQKITCGGGGAFLHPTHGADVRVLHDAYTLRTTFPTQKDSRKATWRNLLFPFRNPRLGIVTGLLYMLLAWAAAVDLSRFRVAQYGDAIRASVAATLRSQGSVAWALVIVGGFIFFTDAHSRWFKWIAGSLHASAHLVAVFCLGWLATFLTVGRWHLPFGSPSQLLLAGLLIFITGWFIGPTIMGTYFIISLNGFGRHTGEAFSPLRIEDWKCFLRIRVDAAGLTIYPVGIRKVWRAWRVSPGGVESPEWVPDEQAPKRHRGTGPALIESPILVTREAHDGDRAV